MMHSTPPQTAAQPDDNSAASTFSLEARVPIYDRDRRIQGYELVVRANDCAPRLHPSSATTNHLFGGIEPARLIGPRFALLDAPAELLRSTACLAFPPTQTLLVIGPEQRSADHLLATLAQRRREGYRLVLDEHLWALELEPLTAAAQWVSVDFARSDLVRLASRVRQWRALGLQLLGRQIDRAEHEARWQELGFDYGQGEALARPRFIASQRIGIDRLSVLKLIHKLNHPDIELEALEEHIAGDVTLSYSLLRLINSPCYGVRDPIESVHRAVVYLGQNALRQWLTVLALRAIHDRRDDVLASALVRARLCRLLCEQVGGTEKDSFFTVGLFSVLETVLQMPMPKILAELPLSEEVKHALLDHAGPMGAALRCARAFERRTGPDERTFGPLTEEKTSMLYVQAVAWSNDHLAQLTL